MTTARQQQAMDFIRSHIVEHGHSPSYHDIMAAIGINSKSGVHRIICALEGLGLIRRAYGRRRSIELVQPVDNALRVVLERCSLSAATRAELSALAAGAQ